MAPSAPRARRGGSARRITVVIGDDSAVVARGLEYLIAEHPDFTVDAVARDRDSLIAAIVRHDPDVVISDLRMPPTGVDEGMQVFRYIRSNRLRTGFIVYTQYRDPAIAAEIQTADRGGRGYLLKGRLMHAEELHSAIRAVAAGHTLIDPTIAIAMRDADPLADLTASQREVLALIAEGLSNEAIAQRLNITAWAVEKRVSALFRSLPIGDTPDVNRRVAAALLFRETRGVNADEDAG